MKDNIDGETSEILLLYSFARLSSFLCSLEEISQYEMVHLWASERS